MASKKIKDEQIVEDIIKVKEKIGKIPSQNDYKANGSFSINSILNRRPWNVWLKEIFNTINTEYSGTNINKVSDEDLLDNLKNIVEKLGRVPEQSELKLGKYSPNAYKRAFGNYSSALEKLGLYASVRYGVSNEEILKDIVRVSKELKRTPFFEEFSKLNNTVSSSTVCERFGSWNAALKEAGLKITMNKNLLKEDITTALNDWFVKNNKDISCLDYWSIRKAKEREDFPYCNATISSKFDNKPWEEIMKECGYDYESVNQFVRRGRFQGFDGRTYLSLIEKRIGDLLFNLVKEGNIKSYEYEKLVCGDKTWTCDFVIIKNNNSDLWLEVDGMLNNRKDPYYLGKNEKIEYYKNNNYNYYIISYRTIDVETTISNLLGE